MTDEADFLRTIIDRPDDPLARSVFADWLEDSCRHAEATFQRILVEPDRDDLRLRWADAVEATEPARAEFVRVQCELAPAKQMGAEMAPPWDALRQRERELTDGIMGLGVDALPIVDGLNRTNAAASGQMGWYPRGERGTNYITATFSRGFVSAVTLSWDDWRRHAAALLAACPIARAADGLVRLTTWPELEVEIPPDINPPFVVVNLRGFRNRFRLAGGTEGMEDFHYARPEVTRRLLDAEFPGVAFSLPAAGEVPPIDRERLDRIRRQVSAATEVATARARRAVQRVERIVSDHERRIIRRVTPEARP